MPQMSPMKWTLIFLVLMIFMLTTMNTMTFFKKVTSNMKKLSKKENSMKW